MSFIQLESQNTKITTNCNNGAIEVPMMHLVHGTNRTVHGVLACSGSTYTIHPTFCIDGQSSEVVLATNHRLSRFDGDEHNWIIDKHTTFRTSILAQTAFLNWANENLVEAPTAILN